MTRRDCNIVWNSYVISYFIIRWNNCVVCFLSDASYHKALEYSHKPMQGVEHLAYKSYLGTSPLGNGGTVLKFSVYGEFSTLTRWLENICSWDCSPGHFCFSFFSNFFCIAILGTYLIENVHLSEALPIHHMCWWVNTVFQMIFSFSPYQSQRFGRFDEYCSHHRFTIWFIMNISAIGHTRYLL